MGDYYSGVALGALLHWDGTAWSTTLRDDTASFFSVGGSGPNDVWSTGGSKTFHWNGTEWSLVATGETGETVQGIWSNGAGDAWFVGAHIGVDDMPDTLKHWDGTGWSGYPVSSVTYLWDVWGSGADDVWAVGNLSNTTKGLLMHWDGSAWSTTTRVNETFYAAWGTAANDVWVAGTGDAIQRWNGTDWSSVSTGTGVSNIKRLWGADANHVWGVGWDSSPTGGGVILQYHR